jgi:[histone H3]-lysine9 N-trimethyltransferase SUV39H
LKTSITASRAQLKFIESLKKIEGPPVTFYNDIDETAPPNDFTFINRSIVGEGVHMVPLNLSKKCKCNPENGRNMGCEYTYCECLGSSNTFDGKHRFFYFGKGKTDGTLRGIFLNERHAIYECGPHCSCNDNCKNKLTQWGRQIRLEIFKTRNGRGFGK